MTRITIIGGGITGLATAYYLQQAIRRDGLPFSVTLLEADSRSGGKIVTHTADGFVMEGGPDSFLTEKPEALRLCRDLGLKESLIPCNSAAQTVDIFRNGRLVPLPKGFRLAIPTRFGPFMASPLISMQGKLRMAMDYFIPPRSDLSDESVADFIGRRLGKEAVELFAGPLMAGIYVSEPEKMSIQGTFPRFVDMERQHGSLIRAALHLKREARKRPGPRPPMFMSLRNGMAQLVEALTGVMGECIQYERTVEQLTRENNQYVVHTANGDPTTTDAVVLALPAPRAADLTAPLSPNIAQALRRIRHVSTATVSLAYREEDLPAEARLNGFGFLVPKCEGHDVLACTCSSTKFGHRAPDGHRLYRVFVGGPGREETTNLPDHDLLQLVQNELEAFLHITTAPLHTAISRWPAGNPQYDVGHLDRMANLERETEHLPGLYLAGSAYRGIGIPDCVRDAKRVVAALTR